jgi:hypothetical protein
LAAPASAAEPQGKLGYNQHIRPILSDNCFACHGPDKNHRQAELRLDQRESAVLKEAIVPGNPKKSELVRRIFADDPDERMPPADSHKKLTDAQKKLLKRWIAEGAQYEPHWAYITPKRPAVPQVSGAAVNGNPIDPFILASLEARKIAPTAEADRRTLLRRLSLDLIGLPPTPAEVEAFVNDQRPDAYERQVERLLASPHYGERMAVAWLDAVRFSDTVGYHGDQNQNIFPYRDYVIDAFNNNKPFDQFTIEQLAGDLLPNPTVEQRIATGFNRLNMMTREGGAQPKEYLAKYAADRVRTVSQAFLGATMGCCECHDHKYDPFTTKDFYALSAYFADVQQWGVYQNYGYTPNPDLKGFNNDSPFPPELIVENAYLHVRRDRLHKQAERLVNEQRTSLLADPVRKKEFDQWRRATADFLAAHATGWITPDAEKLKADADGSLPLPEKESDNMTLTFRLAPGPIAAIRLEALPDSRFKGQIVRGEKGSQPALTLAATLTPGKKGKLASLSVLHADADARDDYGHVNGRPVLGVEKGWKVCSTQLESPQTACYLLAEPVIAADGDRLTITLAKNPLACVRISVSPLAALEPLEPEFAVRLRKALAAGDAGSPEDRALVLRTWILGAKSTTDARQPLRKLQHELAQLTGGRTATLVTVAVPPVTTRVLPRGNWQDESGQIVQPATPGFLPHANHVKGQRLTRLDLARWIVADDNPLTSRAIMNRLWKQFFGNGVSGNVEDLGAQGEWPSHPELLDWLAVEFRESKWNVKHMVRLIVISRTYRQDSRLRAELLVSDPQNRLLASQNPRRLEAEFVRDNALFISGLINLDMGGPSSHPYQPAGYYENLQFPDRNYVNDLDQRQYRRGLYTHWQRTFLHPMLANFDAPPRENAACTRIVSNTPQQALTLLNDPTFVEAARVLAQRVVADADNTEARLERIYQLALCRSPKSAETQSLARFLKTQQEYFAQHPEDVQKLVKVGLSPVPAGDAAELAAWTSVCRVVLNLHETITRY